MLAFRDYTRALRRQGQAPATIEFVTGNTARFMVWLGQHLRLAPQRLVVSDLDTEALADFHHFLWQTQGRTAAYANKCARIVHAAWEWMYDHDTLGDLVVRPPRKLLLPTVSSTPVSAPTFAQLDAMVEHISVGWHQQVATVMRFTGLRIGQVVRLHWDDFDLEGASLTIRGELGKSKKERRGRIIPISAHLVAELAGWGKREGSLFPVSILAKGNRPRTRVKDWRAVAAAASKGIGRAWAVSGLPKALYGKRPAHAFRKGFRTGLRALGAAPPAIDALVGHVSGGSTGDRDYTAAWGIASEVRAAVELVPARGNDATIYTLPTAAKGE